ncbi:MAG: hypothetical protein HGA63_11155 [Syntrophobacteraceae bacterium]|nr:hypothetical protein [Syntrophobacteraceae bacterium]
MDNRLDRSSFRKSFWFLITGRTGIIALDLLIALISFGGLCVAYILWRNAENDFGEMTDLIEGIATIFVAYGVAIEERETFMEILGLYPEHASARERGIDHMCHVYGLCILVVGLIVEFLSILFKISSRLRGIEGSETGVFILMILCTAAAVFLLLRHSVLLFRLPQNGEPSEDGDGMAVSN